MNKLKIVSTGYLYIYRRGEFKMMEGTVYVYEGNHYWARFYVGEHKFYQCSPKSGALENCCVWFEKRDDDKARDIFIQYEEKKITRLKKDIERREDAIIEISCAQFKVV